jgi:hypothetical protein
MKFTRNLSEILIIAIVLITVSTSCTTGKYLKTESAKGTEIIGTYSVLFYANRNPIEPKTIAILDIEGDDYAFEINAPEKYYTISNGVPAMAALKDAIQFVESLKYRINKILDDNGRIIGYDVRPLKNISYNLGYGLSDILAVNYEIKDMKVVVNVDLKSHFKEHLRRDLFGGD